jgi:hypothetical protein
MAWVALWFILILFSIGLLSFLAALFWVDRAGIAKTLLGGVDTLLGLALRTVMANLFPPPKAQVDKQL